MSPRARLAAAVMLLVGLCSGLVSGRLGTPPAQQPQFRTTADVVLVDVSVQSGGALVAGLTASDFVLLDNGVPQHIDDVEAESMPIDLTLIIDTSGSTAGVVDQLKRNLREIAALLRPDDRLQLLTMDTYVNQVFRMQSAATHPPIDQMTANGLSSVYDALVAAMLGRVEPNRRHLIIAETDAMDTMSAVEAHTVLDVAKHSDAVLHLVHLNVEFEQRYSLIPLTAAPARYWLPQFSHNLATDFAVLAEAAKLTGGDEHVAGSLTGEVSAVQVFKEVFAEFRRRYILRFTPQGVPRGGWHTLTVRVAGSKDSTIHARTGYAIDTSVAPPAPAAAAPPPIGTPLSTSRAPTLGELTGAYDRGDYAGVQAGLQRIPDLAKFIRTFMENGNNPWPATPRREAVFALELANAALFRHTNDAREEARKLLLQFNRLVRQPLGADGFERLWYWAELAQLQGIIRPDMGGIFVANALARCPDDPRFLLARAIFADQAQLTQSSGAQKALPPVPNEYDAALASPATAPEARVRQAYAIHRGGEHDRAAAIIAQVDEHADRVLLYLSQLIRGHILDAAGHGDAAADAYRAALLTWPNAQAPRVGLMTLFLRQGDHREAETMAERIQTAPDDTFDPWWQYWQGDYRLYPAIIASLRQVVR